MIDTGYGWLRVTAIIGTTRTHIRGIRSYVSLSVGVDVEHTKGVLIALADVKVVRSVGRNAIFDREGAHAFPRPMWVGGGSISRAFSTGPACEAKLLRGHNETKKVEDR
jgi:hypothetical protein